MDVTVEFFDSTLKHNWDMSTVDRSFDAEKVKMFLSTFGIPEDRQFIEELLNKTLYVNYEQFKTSLIKAFESFSKDYTESFHLLVPKYKFGSEHWLIALLWSRFKTLKLESIIADMDGLPIKPINLVIVNDAIYSGWNICSIIDELLYNLSKRCNLKYDDVGKLFTIHIITPYVTRTGCECILGLCESYNVKSRIYAVYKLLELPQLIKLDKYYSCYTINLILII